MASNEIVLVVMLAMSNGEFVHVIKPITGYGYYNMTHCQYFAHDLRKAHALRSDVEIINIGCPYQATPIE